MSDVEQRLREAHPNSQQYAYGSMIFLEAADEIRDLKAQLAQAEARVAELKNLCERLQHCAAGFYVDQGDYGHMEAIMQDYHAVMRGDATHPTDSGQGGSQ